MINIGLERDDVRVCATSCLASSTRRWNGRGTSSLIGHLILGFGRGGAWWAFRRRRWRREGCAGAWDPAWGSSSARTSDRPAAKPIKDWTIKDWTGTLRHRTTLATPPRPIQSVRPPNVPVQFPESEAVRTLPIAPIDFCLTSARASTAEGPDRTGPARCSSRARASANGIVIVPPQRTSASQSAVAGPPIAVNQRWRLASQRSSWAISRPHSGQRSPARLNSR